MSDPQNDGGLAFPFATQGPTTAPECYYGMTLRDYFAAAAMQGWLASCVDAQKHPFESGLAWAHARNAYGMADAMLEARSK